MRSELNSAHCDYKILNFTCAIPALIEVESSNSIFDITLHLVPCISWPIQPRHPKVLALNIVIHVHI